MRQNTDRIVALSKALNRSVEGAKRDTHIELNPVLSSVIELPGNFKGFTNAAVLTDQFDSFRRVDNLVVAGAGAGQVVNGPILTPGVWRIGGYIESHFTGTTNNGVSNVVQLNDIDGVTGAFVLFLHQMWTGTHVFFRPDFTLSIAFRARIEVQLAATVVGDSATIFSSLLCNKLI